MPANAGDTGWIPVPEDPTRCKVTKPLQRNYWSPRTNSLCSTREATTRSLLTTTRKGPRTAMKTQKSQKLFKLKKKKTFPREVKKHFETKMDILHTNLPGCSKSSTKKKVHRNSYVNNNKRTQINNLLYTSSRSVVSDSLKPRGLYSPWNSPGKNTGMGSLSLLKGIFPTQGSNPGFQHCRWILHQLSHKISPRILEWVAYPFANRSSQLRNRTRVSCIAGGFFTNWASSN